MNCELCGYALSEKEPIYRATTTFNWPRRPGVMIHSVCARCKHKHFAHAKWRPAEPCKHCERPVIIQVGPRKRPRIVVCDMTCRRSLYATVARLARHLGRSERVCPGCGNGFVLKRKDARYCSPTCRKQAGHRRRNLVALRALDPPPEEVRRVGGAEAGEWYWTRCC
jgi:hypothetical protein